MKHLKTILISFAIIALAAYGAHQAFSPTQCCQLECFADIKQTMHSAENFTLITRLTETSLCLSLQEFDFSHDQVTEYQLQLANETLSEEMTFAFQSVGKLYDWCFQKSKNYVLKGSGLISFKLMVMLQDQQAHEQQIVLQMTRTWRSAKEQYQAYIEKIKLNTKEQIEKNVETIKKHEKTIKETQRQLQAHKDMIQHEQMKKEIERLEIKTYYMREQQKQNQKKLGDVVAYSLLALFLLLI